MTNHIIGAAKAYAAFVGAGVTAAISVWPDAPRWVLVASAVCTGLATYAIPNKPEPIGKHEAR